MRILCVVSGGDAPGINTALYHGAVLAAHYRDRVFGAHGGFAGLLNAQITPFTAPMLLPWAGLAGAYFPSSRDPVLAQADAQARIHTVLSTHNIDALLLFGGDGTLRHIPPLLESWGIACIGLPTTIDNDVLGTDLTLGFDSACNFALPMIDGLRATGHALGGRIFTLETLGGPTGFLALAVAHSGGANAVLIPEYTVDLAQIATRLSDAVQLQGQALLVYSEGVAHKTDMLDQLGKLTGIRVRSSHLGHAQRGAIPSRRDRALAAEMMRLAFIALHDGVKTGVIVVQGDEARLHTGRLNLPASAPKTPDATLYRQINGLAGASDEHLSN